MTLLQDRYGRIPDVVATLDEDEVEEVMGALLELRTLLRNLQWFGEINRRGFVKITKKLDKKVPEITAQHSYISTKVDPKPFARDGNITRLLVEINRWLSALGDAQNMDDSKSERSTRSLGRASAKAMLQLPQAQLDMLDQSVRQDDVEGLKSGLEKTVSGSDGPAQSLLHNLLQRSISARSRGCITHLLPLVADLDEPDDINGRNCIHRLVIHIGRTKSAQSDDENPVFPVPVGTQFTNRHLQPAVSNNAPTKAINTKESHVLSEDDEALKVLEFLFEHLEPSQRRSLSTRDSLGRLPLHYAAQFGFVVVCQVIMARMQAWNQFDAKDGIDAPEWQDGDGNAPLHLAVIGGHPLTTKALLQGENWQGSSKEKAEIRKSVSKSAAVLALATKANFTVIVQMLVDAGVDINWADSTGETALHVAARFSHHECAAVLLQGTPSQKANIELTEKSYAWTPLHVAAVDGALKVVELLIEAGADLGKPDASGWTAREHAALRGHMEIARLLSSYEDETASAARVAEAPTLPTVAESSSIDGRRSNGTNGNARTVESTKSFGHRYLTNESLVLVSMGSMDLRKATDAVNLDRVPLTEAHNTQLDTALSMVVSANGAQGEPTTIDLPIHESIITEPVVFTTTDASTVKLLFDIVPTYSGSQKNKIGRAVALLSTIKPKMGVQRMNLQGDMCVPIMSSNLDVIGTVNFHFLVITPFSHPNMGITSQQTYWKKMETTMLIGHRGLGKNATSNRSLQLGENTLPSFIAAANLGAQYVEFDVQLTKDHVPVIYHDFLVSETGIDAPVHTLTLEQFLHINPDKRHRAPTEQIKDAQEAIIAQGGRRGRSNSFTPQRSHSMGFAGSGYAEMEDRMRHTRDYKEKGFKANSRGNFIQAPFATLEDLFRKLPEHIGFNIEMKYPMLHETEEHDMDAYAVELNSFCDTVLSKVYDLAGERHLILSSFNPDICLCLSFKQPSIPIMFLTDAGCSGVSDIRASSLQEAIRFASRWNLLGIVSAAEPLINSPRLVRVVKENGLVCVSYGSSNNDSAMVQVRF